MSEKTFIDLIFKVAEQLKGNRLTASERSKIIELFNKKTGTAYERAKFAIEEVVGRKIETYLLLEKAASLNNLQNLLAQMNAAANSWQEANE